jgi:hypothetical protein
MKFIIRDWYRQCKLVLYCVPFTSYDGGGGEIMTDRTVLIIMMQMATSLNESAQVVMLLIVSKRCLL